MAFCASSSRTLSSKVRTAASVMPATTPCHCWGTRSSSSTSVISASPPRCMCSRDSVLHSCWGSTRFTSTASPYHRSVRSSTRRQTTLLLPAASRCSSSVMISARSMKRRAAPLAVPSAAHQSTSPTWWVAGARAMTTGSSSAMPRLASCAPQGRLVSHTSRDATRSRPCQPTSSPSSLCQNDGANARASPCAPRART